MRFWVPVLLCISSSNLLAIQDANGPGSIEGRVTNSKSGEPLKKALVILRSGQNHGTGTYTDGAGKFSFRAVEPGSYTIAAEHDGYVTIPGAKVNVVEVKAGDRTSNVALQLLPTGAISGHVFDAEGEPVLGASIQIEAATAKKRASAAGSGAGTNDRGEYRVHSLPPGKYRISASFARGMRHPDVSLQEAANPADAPVEEAYAVTYYPGTSNARDAAIVTVEAGADLAGFDLQLRPMRAVRVRGTVSGPGGAPVGFAAVSLYPAGGQRLSADTLVVSTDGRFEVGGILPGRYILSAQTAMAQMPLTARRVVDVGEEGLNGVQLILAEQQKLEGRVLVPEGRKLPAVMVTLIPREGEGSQGGGMAQPSSDGSFTMAGVPPGDYDVAIGNVGAADDLYVAGIRMGESDALADGVHANGAALPKMEITFKGNGGTLACSVVNADQEPVAEAYVALVPDPPRQSQMAIFGDCRTDAKGSCTIVGISPGEYHALAFVTEEERNLRDPDALKEFQKFTKAVKVAQGDQLKVELKAVPEE